MFHGYGKLYKNKYIDKSRDEINYYLDYEGNFVMGNCEGNGIKYYITGEKLYEGLFKNNKIYGKGIKYYKIGLKK